jgi:isoleucyl-tRNA synthetase
MYTFAPTSRERRSAQTVLWRITETLTRLVAPVLSFTADEVWEHLPAVEGREASVHLAQFPKPEEIFSENPAPILDEWKKLFEFRDSVLKLLENERQNQVIGKGLEAEIQIWTRGNLYDLLTKYGEVSLKEILNVSQVILNHEKDIPRLVSESNISVTGMVTGKAIVKTPRATGHKCARCWNFMPEVSNYGIWQNVCTRCQDALTEMKIEPPQTTEAAS